MYLKSIKTIERKAEHAIYLTYIFLHTLYTNTQTYVQQQPHKIDYVNPILKGKKNNKLPRVILKILNISIIVQLIYILVCVSLQLRIFKLKTLSCEIIEHKNDIGCAHD